MSDNNGCKTCAGFMMGAIIGGILGLLFAPKKGKETREDLKGWVDNALEEGKGKTGDLHEDFTEKMQTLGDSLKTHTGKLKQTIKDHKNKFLPPDKSQE